MKENSVNKNSARKNSAKEGSAKNNSAKEGSAKKNSAKKNSAKKNSAKNTAKKAAAAKYGDLFIRPCGRDDLEAIFELQDAVFSGLPDASVLRRNPPELFALALEEPNLTVGVFSGDMLAAVGMLVDPKPPETDLRANLQKFTVEKALDMKLIIVRGDYRGRGLQRAIMLILEKVAFTRGCRKLCTSVSPNNVYSLRNVTGLGYLLDHQETLYGGLLRNVYVKEIEVAEFGLRAALSAGKLEGTPFRTEATDLSDFIPGDLSLSFSGDVAEFISKTTGESVFGLLIKEQAPFVLLPDKDNNWAAAELAPAMSGDLVLKNVWLNTTANSPTENISTI